MLRAARVGRMAATHPVPGAELAHQVREHLELERGARGKLGMAALGRERRVARALGAAGEEDFAEPRARPDARDGRPRHARRVLQDPHVLPPVEVGKGW